MTTPSLSIGFDALEFVELLKASGVPEEQAKSHMKVLAAVVRQLDTRVEDLAARREKQSEERFDSMADRHEQQVKGRLDGLATKQELLTVEASLKRDIQELDTKTEARLKELELRMVIKTGAMIIGGIGLLFGLMRAWPLPVQPVQSPAAMQPAAPAPRPPG